MNYSFNIVHLINKHMNIQKIYKLSKEKNNNNSYSMTNKWTNNFHLYLKQWWNMDLLIRHSSIPDQKKDSYSMTNKWTNNFHLYLKQWWNMDLLIRHSSIPDLKFTHQQLLGWLVYQMHWFYPSVFTSRSWQCVLQILKHLDNILVQSRHVFFMFSREHENVQMKLICLFSL